VRGLISYERVNGAAATVHKELRGHGFWQDNRLGQTEIYWCQYPNPRVPDAEGFFFHENQLDITHALMGFEIGHIYIPSWALLHPVWKQRNFTMRDVIRHEYGHAMAHHYPMMIQRSDRFREVFGGDYFAEDHNREGEVSEFVSGYAETNPAEDFAENLMFYLKNKGKLPIRLRTPAIRRKWRFIRDLGRVVSAGGSKW